MKIRWKESTLPCFQLASLATGLLLLISPAFLFAQTAKTVIVNFASDQGAVTYRASGFLHGISGTKPPASLISPVKPKTLRFGCCNWNYSTYARARHLGADVQLVVSDILGYRVLPNAAAWQQFIGNQVRQAKKTNQVLHWDIWNEPNLSQFWPGSQSQFFEIWRLAVVQIRSLDPAAVIIGPSVSGFDLSYIQTFLSYAKANNVLPDVLSWHDFDAPNDIPEHVQFMRSWLSANKINISRFSINEFINGDQYAMPGISVHYIANLERAGVESAVRACWPEGSGNNCNNTSLDGILTSDASQPRSSWWVYKGYADITGHLVGLTAGTSVDGIAGQDPTVKTAKVLLGRNGGSENVAIRFTKISSVSYLNNDGMIHVVAERIPDSGSNALTSPTQMIKADYAVVNNELTVILPRFGGSDAYTITLTAGTIGGSHRAETSVP